MTLRNWLKQYEGYKDSLLDKDILIECPNGLLVEPRIVLKRKDLHGGFTVENVEALVITHN